MTWSKSTRTSIHRLEAVRRELEAHFVGRGEAAALLVLATLCREHLLLLGPPGTAKTEMITRFTTMVEARGFHYLLNRFSEPAELFGPPDMSAFQQGRWQIQSTGMLPEAEIAFLDEVFQGSSAILNALLALAAERVFHNGAERSPCPLWTLIGASNLLPDDPSLEAFADRFVLRLVVAPVAEPQFEELLQRGWRLEQERARKAELLPMLHKQDLVDLQDQVANVALGDLLPRYAELMRELRAEGLALSDRRMVRGLKLVAGAALLAGRERAEPADLWPIRHLWSRPEQADVLASAVERHLGDGPSTHPHQRSAQDLRLELTILATYEANLSGEVALGAHLLPLNQLREEVLLQHPHETELLAEIEQAITRIIARLEAVYV
jgi:MoxR-like ATPase